MRVARQADRLVERLEPVGELELVALVAAEELDARQPLVRRAGASVSSVATSPGEYRASAGSNAEAVDVHRAPSSAK